MILRLTRFHAIWHHCSSLYIDFRSHTEWTFHLQHQHKPAISDYIQKIILLPSTNLSHDHFLTSNAVCLCLMTCCSVWACSVWLKILPAAKSTTRWSISSPSKTTHTVPNKCVSLSLCFLYVCVSLWVFSEMCVRCVCVRACTHVVLFRSAVFFP